MAVKSAFGRKGVIVAEPGDYAASQVTNDSSVAGASLQHALDNLNTELAARPRLAGDLGGTPEQPQVVGLRGRALADTAPNDGDRLYWNATAQQWEPRAGAALAPALGAVYDVNFAELPAQTFTAAGQYTIDGLAWWMKGALASQINALEPGAGLRLSFVTDNDGGGRPASNVNTTYNWRACFMPFAQIPGFNPLAPTIIRWVSTHATSGLNAGVTGWGGIVSAAASAANLTAAERDTYHLVGTPHGTISGTTNAVDFVRTDNQQSPGNATPTATINANGAHEYGLHLNGRVSYEYVAPTPWAGLWTEDPSVMSSVAPWRGPLRPNMGFLFIMGGQLSALPVYIKRLRIEQPRMG